MNLRSLKLGLLERLQGGQVFDLVAGSRWRSSRLLILCYHGISLRDEHIWSPGLYMSRDTFAARLRAIRSEGCNVLPLAEGITRLYHGDLPPRSVIITFDDGLFDFFAQARPLLEEYGFPATVYLTTYYSEYNRPIFRLVCDYMMWEQRGKVAGPGPAGETIDLRTAESRALELRKLENFAASGALSAQDKDLLAQDFARRIGAEWQAILDQRLFHIMNPREARQTAEAGFDLQLHTHRHRTPRDASLFRAELDDNAVRLRELTGHQPTHFCYPGGVHYAKYPEWLRNWGVESAVTCDLGMAEPQTDAMLLPRLCDHASLSEIEFEGWLCGLLNWFPRRNYPAVESGSGVL